MSTEPPLTNEQVLNLKVAELMLNRGFVESAFDSLARGVRPAGRSGRQVMILKHDFEELKRRVEDAAKTTWPKLP